MNMRRWITGLLLSLTLVAGAAWWLQRQATEGLRGEIAWLREERGELARLETEHRRLEASAVKAEELARWRDEHAAVVRLRGEIETMRRGIEARERAVEPGKR